MDSQRTKLAQAVKEKYASNEPPIYSLKFQILATALVLASALSGASLGAIFSETQADPELISWIALPGDLFIRALKCVVLPLVFVTILLAVIQMAEAGKAAIVGKYTILLYLGSTTLASLEGLLMVLFFKPFFSKKIVDPQPTFVRILCPDKSSILAHRTGALYCLNESSFENMQSQEFEIVDLNNKFASNIEIFEALSFSETLQENIFKQLVPENITKEFADFRFIGVVMFAILFGAASQSVKKSPVLIINFLEEINDVLMQIINWIIFVTPLAVFSLVTGALAPQQNLPEVMQDIGVLMVSTILTDLIHITLVWPLVFYSLTKTNPYEYMKFLIPAQFFGFSCASSAATLPVTMRCVTASKLVPDSIRDFVLPLGATINMDGIAIYFPGALLYLADSANLETGIAEYILIVLVSTIGSAGTAPVVNGSILLLLTAYTTVYGGVVPETFGILVGIQWFIDRFTVIVNVSGDALVARVVTCLSKTPV